MGIKLPTDKTSIEHFAIEDIRAGLLDWLGKTVLTCLLQEGIVTFFIRDNRERDDVPEDERLRLICIAPVTHVYLLPEAFEDVEHARIKKFIRPILTSGRPAYAAKRDGVWWEVELEGGTNERDHEDDAVVEHQDSPGREHP